MLSLISLITLYFSTCVVAVDAVDDWLLLLLLPDAEVLALLVDEFHGVVEAPVAHGDRPHGAGLEDDSELGVGLTEGGIISNLRCNHL